MKKFKHLVYAGTFDHLHKGHKKLIDEAFKKADRVSLGVTTVKMYEGKSFFSTILSLKTRMRELKSYLEEKHYIERSRIFTLYDIYGTAVTDETMDAILVSKNTTKNALKINTIRKERGLYPLNIILAKDVLADDKKQLSSERIRAGEINRNGFVYSSLFSKNLVLPKRLRSALQRPLGNVFTGEGKDLSVSARKVKEFLYKKNAFIITVGDVVTESLLNVEIKSHLAIIDFRTQRKDISVSTKFRYTVSNEAGKIEKKAVTSIISALKKRKTKIIIRGEEDLLALPAIILASLGSYILYGQWNMGIIVVEVSEDIKIKVVRLLQQFESV